MNTDPVKLHFNPDFVGALESPTGSIKLGQQAGGMKPYHLLYGAMASCFYATFLSISNKMRLSFSNVTIDVSGHKREEEPTTLDYVKVVMKIEHPSDEQKLTKAANLGMKHCSIVETISKVAEIELMLIFD